VVEAPSVEKTLQTSGIDTTPLNAARAAVAKVEFLESSRNASKQDVAEAKKDLKTNSDKAEHFLVDKVGLTKAAARVFLAPK